MDTTNSPIVSFVAPARERGLKCTGKYNREGSASVAPARERGLKFGSALGAVTGGSRSREGAWIEIKKTLNITLNAFVAPARERGLKYQLNFVTYENKKSLPRGSVD